MPEINQVVVHFNDGKILKGTTQDFNPVRPTFHIHPAPGAPGTQVQCSLVKAIFFVKDLKGDPKHVRLPGFVTAPGETLQGKKIAALFEDGELICGYTLAYTPGRMGFFVSPTDPGGNNIRIFIVESSAVKVKAGPAADALVQEVVQQQQKKD